MEEAQVRRARARKRTSPAASRWQALIAGWSRSGQTQRAYCHRMGISFGTFAWWKHELTGSPSGRARPGQRAATSPRFVRVDVLAPGGPASSQAQKGISTEVTGAPPPASSFPLEILLPGDIRVRVGLDCGGDLLGRVLATLRGVGC